MIKTQGNYLDMVYKIDKIIITYNNKNDDLDSTDYVKIGNNIN